MMIGNALMAAAGCVLVCASISRAEAQAAHSAPSAADQISDGTWRGWIQQGDADSIRVSYQVQHAGKHSLITLQGRSGIVYDMSDVKVKDDVLTFDWPMGLNQFLYCRLTRRDGKSFEGSCNDRSPGETGKPIRVWMIMNPP